MDSSDSEDEHID